MLRATARSRRACAPRIHTRCRAHCRICGYLIYVYRSAATHLGDLQLQRRDSAEHGTECDPTRVAMSNSQIQMASTRRDYILPWGATDGVCLKHVEVHRHHHLFVGSLVVDLVLSERRRSGSSSYSMRSVWIFTSMVVSKWQRTPLPQARARTTSLECRNGKLRIAHAKTISSRAVPSTPIRSSGYGSPLSGLPSGA